MLGKERKILNKIFLLYCLNLRTEASFLSWFGFGGKKEEAVVVPLDKKEELKKPKKVSSIIVASKEKEISLDEKEEESCIKSCLNLFKDVAGKKFSEVWQYLKNPNKSLIPEYEWIENLKKKLKEKCPWLDNRFLKIGLVIGSILFSYFSGTTLLTGGYIFTSYLLNCLHDIFINRKQYKDDITCSELTKILASKWAKSNPNESSNWNIFFKVIHPFLSIIYWYLNLNFDKCPVLIAYEVSDPNYAALEFASKCSDINISNGIEILRAAIVPSLNDGIINSSLEENSNDNIDKKKDNKNNTSSNTTPNNIIELEEINRKKMKLNEQLRLKTDQSDQSEIKKTKKELNQLECDEKKIQIKSENLTYEEQEEKKKEIDYNLKEENLKVDIDTAENPEIKKKSKEELIKLKENKLKNLEEKILEKKKMNENTEELEKERDNQEFLLNNNKIENEIYELENNKEVNLEVIMKKIEDLENLNYEKKRLEIINKINKIKENKEERATDQSAIQIKSEEEKLKDLEEKHKVKILKEQINYLKKNKDPSELLKEKQKQLENFTNRIVSNQKETGKATNFKLPLITVIIGGALIYFGINSEEDQEEIQI